MRRRRRRRRSLFKLTKIRYALYKHLRAHYGGRFFIGNLNDMHGSL